MREEIKALKDHPRVLAKWQHILLRNFTGEIYLIVSKLKLAAVRDLE